MSELMFEIVDNERNSETAKHKVCMSPAESPDRLAGSVQWLGKMPEIA